MSGGFVVNGSTKRSKERRKEGRKPKTKTEPQCRCDDMGKCDAMPRQHLPLLFIPLQKKGNICDLHNENNQQSLQSSPPLGTSRISNGTAQVAPQQQQQQKNSKTATQRMMIMFSPLAAVESDTLFRTHPNCCLLHTETRFSCGRRTKEKFLNLHTPFYSKKETMKGFEYSFFSPSSFWVTSSCASIQLQQQLLVHHCS